jgi:hypothetical protein
MAGNVCPVLVLPVGTYLEAGEHNPRGLLASFVYRDPRPTRIVRWRCTAIPRATCLLKEQQYTITRPTNELARRLAYILMLVVALLPTHAPSTTISPPP